MGLSYFLYFAKLKKKICRCSTHLGIYVKWSGWSNAINLPISFLRLARVHVLLHTRAAADDCCGFSLCIKRDLREDEAWMWPLNYEKSVARKTNTENVLSIGLFAHFLGHLGVFKCATSVQVAISWPWCSATQCDTSAANPRGTSLDLGILGFV